MNYHQKQHNQQTQVWDCIGLQKYTEYFGRIAQVVRGITTWPVIQCNLLHSPKMPLSLQIYCKSVNFRNQKLFWQIRKNLTSRPVVLHPVEHLGLKCVKSWENFLILHQPLLGNISENYNHANKTRFTVIYSSMQLFTVYQKFVFLAWQLINTCAYHRK